MRFGFFSLLTVTPLAALPAQYARAPGDTVRYHQVTSARVTVAGPRGEVPVSVRQDLVVAVTFAPGDTARAWYESLILEATSPDGTQRPFTSPALRQPFTLKFDERGRVTTLSAPEFPESFEGVSDLTHQFDDFFPTLPARPLAAGATWVDTTTHSSVGANGRTFRSRRISRYHVERDTTVDGVAALVISSTHESRFETDGPVRGRPATRRSMLAGRQRGIDVFAPQSGRYLGRRRTGDLTGTLTVTTGGRSVRLRQSMSAESVVQSVVQSVEQGPGTRD